MLHRSGAMMRPVRTLRMALGLAGCALLAACASSGDNGGDAPFDFLRLSEDTGGTTADGDTASSGEPANTNDTAGAGDAAEDGESANETTMAADTAGPAAPTTAEKPMKGMPPARAAPGDAESEAQAELTPRYCYRTLAEVDCYSAPRPDRRRQRVGSFHDTVQ